MMKKLKRIALVVGALLLVLATSGTLWVRSLLKHELSRDTLVLKIEAATNSRASIDDVQWSLGASPATVRLTKLQLATRDADADAAKPLAQRSPLLSNTVQVVANSATLELHWAELLLSQRLHIGKLTLDGLYIRQEIGKEGEDSLALLLEKPQASSPATVASAEQPPATKASEPGKPEPTSTASATEPTASPAEVAGAGLALAIDEIVLSNAAYHGVNRRDKLRTDISELRLVISHIDVDPADLEHRNRCDIDLTAKLAMEGRVKRGEEIQPVQVAETTFTAKGEATLIDLSTGELAPSTRLTLTLPQASKLGGHTTIGEAFGKRGDLADLKDKIGLDLSAIPLGGQLQQPFIAKLETGPGHFHLIEATDFTFTDYSLALTPGSLADAANDAVAAGFALTLSKPMSEAVIKAAEEKLGLLANLAQLAAKALDNGQGQLRLKAKLTGKLSKPDWSFGE